MNRNTDDKLYCPYCLKKNSPKHMACSHCSYDLLLNRSYYILDILGENKGITYLAIESKKQTANEALLNPKYVVIKEFSMKKMKVWKEEELFLREQRILSSLQHPFIPKIIETFEIREGKRISYYTVQEYIPSDYLNANHLIFNEKETLAVLLKLSDILHYLHQKNPPVIHRDIKLSNIIFKEKEVYLIDFGSATNILHEEGSSTIAGTFGYMAPEQFLGKAYPASDYYALGVLGLVLLTGKPPEDLIKNFQVQWKNIEVSDKMKVILMRLLSYETKSRISSKKELLNLIYPPAKEKQIDIVSFLKEYQNLNKSYKSAKKLKPYEIMTYLLEPLATYFFYPKPLPALLISTSLFLTSFTAFYFLKESRYQKKLLASLKKLPKSEDKNLKIATLDYFAQHKFSKNTQRAFYKTLEKEFNKDFDIEVIMHYRKILEDSRFIGPHIRGINIYSDQYIKALEEKLNDPEENNFLISTKNMVHI